MFSKKVLNTFFIGYLFCSIQVSNHIKAVTHFELTEDNSTHTICFNQCPEWPSEESIHDKKSMFPYVPFAQSEEPYHAYKAHLNAAEGYLFIPNKDIQFWQENITKSAVNLVIGLSNKVPPYKQLSRFSPETGNFLNKFFWVTFLDEKTRNELLTKSKEKAASSSSTTKHTTTKLSFKKK